MRKLIAFAALACLAACGATSSQPAIVLPAITPQHAAADVSALATTAGNLLPLLDPSLPVGKASQIQADIAGIKTAAGILSTTASFNGSALKDAETALNDLIAIGSDPAILALVPAKDQSAWSDVFVALNLAAPVIEADLNAVIAPSVTTTANLAPAAAAPSTPAPSPAVP